MKKRRRCPECSHRIYYHRGQREFLCPHCGFPDPQKVIEYQAYQKRTKEVPIFRIPKREPEVRMPTPIVSKPIEEVKIVEPKVSKKPKLKLWLKIWYIFKRLFQKKGDDVNDRVGVG